MAAVGVALPSSVFDAVFSQNQNSLPSVPREPTTPVARYNRAWNSATRFLHLPRDYLTTHARDLSRTPDAENALQFLLSAKASKKKLLHWYLSEVTTHFRELVLSQLQFWQEPIPLHRARHALAITTEVLQKAQHVYLAMDSNDHEPLSSRQYLYAFMELVKQELHVLVLHSLPRQRLQKTLSSYLFHSMKDSLASNNKSTCSVASEECHCTVKFDLRALHDLHAVGLGGRQGERAFAHAVHRLLQGPAIERRCFQVDWAGQRGTTQKLKTWISTHLLPALDDALACFRENDVDESVGGQANRTALLECVSQCASQSFGRLRCHSLFDYVSLHPNSGAALSDIKESLSGSAEKAHLCSTFNAQMQRLLHAGATTQEILAMYVNIINTFRGTLDSRGVLLEKVAAPVRAYLRHREGDTLSSVALSFLGRQSDSGDSDQISEAVANSAIDADDVIVNWNDMEWVPDPIDAGPNHKASKSDDVVAHILALFEPDDFVKAFSHALGQHLLQTQDTEFMRETKVIELLKSRLDSGKLQHAEVMLKDMRESAQLNRRLNPNPIRRGPPPTPREIQAAIPEEGITFASLYEPFKSRIDSKQFQASVLLVAKRRSDLYFPKRTRLPIKKSGREPQTKAPLAFEAKVLSSYFWPQVRDDKFRVPLKIQRHKQRYEQAFAAASGQRRLVWRPALDTTDFTIGFADREVVEKGIECWKTSILDAFCTERDPEDGDPPARYDPEEGISVDELVDAFNMPEDFVQGALSYWLGRKVLYEKSPGRYAVLERLSMDVGVLEEPSELGEVNLDGGIMSTQARLKQMAPTFMTFILEMLRNQGFKEIGGPFGITNMMKMVLPSFDFGDDEVKWLLGELESRGEAKKKGEGWVIA